MLAKELLAKLAKVNPEANMVVQINGTRISVGVMYQSKDKETVMFVPDKTDLELAIEKFMASSIDEL